MKNLPNKYLIYSILGLVVVISLILIIILSMANPGITQVANNNPTSYPASYTTPVTTGTTDQIISYPTSDNPNDPVTTQTDSVGTFKSERYYLSFKYPTAMGATTVKYLEDYFKNESISFQNSKLIISYWHFEGGVGGTLNTYAFTTADNKLCNVYTFNQGVNHEMFGILGSCPDIYPGAAVVFLAQNLATQEEMDANISNIKSIIESMKFEYSITNPN